MAKSLYPKREARLSKTHMFWGVVVIVVLIVVAFALCSVPPLA